MHKKFKLSFQKGIFQGLGIVVVILFFLGTAWAVTGLVGTYNSFSDGETLTASKLNANFNALKTAIASTVGTISAYGGNTAPTGWLLCDGTAISQTTYADLFAVIGCNFGCSGGNFNLPDLRGRFLRGRDGSTTRDPDRVNGCSSVPAKRMRDWWMLAGVLRSLSRSKVIIIPPQLK